LSNHAALKIDSFLLLSKPFPWLRLCI
jgi:hypothetical protein